jgi:hypothetical protein
MDRQARPTITPTPDDDEAAAILVALHAHLAAQRASVPPPARRTPIWALAGRLASQGQTLTYARGARPGWTRTTL